MPQETMASTYDVIVIGASGAMGSAALLELSKISELRILGIDQYPAGHQHGSSHGKSRIVRKAIGEHPMLTPFALRSYEKWDELAEEVGEPIIRRTGGLLIEEPNTASWHGATNFLDSTIAAARAYEIKYQELDAEEIQHRFPQFILKGNERGYYEPDTGFVVPETCIKAQINGALENGIHLVHEEVLEWRSSEECVWVKTNQGQYECGMLILAAGPWIQRLLEKEYRFLFTVYRQTMFWFSAPTMRMYQAPDFPIFIWLNDERAWYGFPVIDFGEGLKVATEQYHGNETTPEKINHQPPTNWETQGMYTSFVEPNLRHVGPLCRKAASCMYTVTPDSQFVLDFHPEHRNVIVVSACSGHGFKHSAAIGEAAVQLALKGTTELDTSSFKFMRLLEPRY